MFWLPSALVRCLEEEPCEATVSAIRLQSRGCVSDPQVLLYSGQLDIIVAAPLTEAMLWKLQWRHQAEYRACKKQVWRLRPNDTDVAGYVRNVKDFYQVLNHTRLRLVWSGGEEM